MESNVISIVERRAVATILKGVEGCGVCRANDMVWMCTAECGIHTAEH